MTGPLRRDHDHVVALRGRDLAEVDGEPVREEDRGTRLQVGLDLRLEDAFLDVVGQQDGDELCATDGIGDLANRQPGGLSLLPRLAPGAQADLDLHAGVAQVQSVRVPLASVADDGHLSVQQVEIAFAVDLCHESSFLDGVW